MVRLLALGFILFLGHTSGAIVHAASDADYRLIAPVLDSAEKLFISIEQSEFDIAWRLLSGTSQKKIINDVYKSSRELNGDINREDIIRDFNRHGIMFTSYWTSLQRRLDTDMILEHSQWEMGFVNGHKAEILIRYNNIQEPTILKMYREHDRWRVGLVETFWPRRGVNILRYIFQ